MITIVGLGNPGSEYKETRHSVGRIVAEHMRKAFKGDEWKTHKKIKGLTTEISIGKKDILLMLPETFMNKSGIAVAPLIKNKKSLEELIVMYDDLDLPIGKIKISYNRSSGGHRGLESIIRAIKSEAFLRIRIGISPKTPSGKIKKPIGEKLVNNHILGTFKPNEYDEIKKVSKKVLETLEVFVEEGKEKMMTIGNAL